MIAARLIIGLRSEVFKGDGDASEKRVQLGIPLIGIGCGDDRRGGWIFRLDAIDLLGIENGIALKKRHLTLAVLAALSTLVGVNLDLVGIDDGRTLRSEEHTSELQSLMRISYAVFCLKKKTKQDKLHYI